MESEGDPRVLLVLNLVLSATFSAMAVAGLSVIGPVEFTLRNVAVGTLFLMVVTWIVVMS